MKSTRAWTATIAAIAVAACSPATPEAEVTTEPTATATVAVSSLNCPAADDAGDIDIAPGLSATIVSKGSGRRAEMDDFADVHTTLWLYDENAVGGRGEEIWSSGGVQPFQFKLGLGQVIKGWDMGVPCMLEGETRELIIDSDLAYGPEGKPPIPPDARLLFNIELVKLTAPH